MGTDEKEALYNRLSKAQEQDDTLTDKDLRDAYFSSIAEQEDRERWEDEQSGW